MASVFINHHAMARDGDLHRNLGIFSISKKRDVIFEMSV